MPLNPNVNITYFNQIDGNLKVPCKLEKEWNVICLGIMKLMMYGSYSLGSCSFKLFSRSLVLDKKQILEVRGDKCYGFMALVEIQDMLDLSD